MFLNLFALQTFSNIHCRTRNEFLHVPESPLLLRTRKSSFRFVLFPNLFQKSVPKSESDPAPIHLQIFPNLCISESATEIHSCMFLNLRSSFEHGVWFQIRSLSEPVPEICSQICSSPNLVPRHKPFRTTTVERNGFVLFPNPFISESAPEICSFPNLVLNLFVQKSFFEPIHSCMFLNLRSSFEHS